jgi:DNA-damage-inducible protein D
MSEQAPHNPGEGVDMKAIEAFHFEANKRSFEDFCRKNGFDHWFASELGMLLGYDDFESFKKVVNRARTACGNLDIPCDENFVSFRRNLGDKEITEVKLSRFACYMTAMNADSRKPQVAAAQAYFAVMAEGFRKYLENAENMARLEVRDEITSREKTLVSTATQAGVEVYAFFHNAGYRGLYNKNYQELINYKGAPQGRSLLDFMGKEELAANLFRITQTEAKIRNEGIQGQQSLQAAAHTVGKAVRNTMIATSGTKPEDLPLAGDIRDTRKKIKATHKEFKRLAKPKTNRA